MKQTDDDNGAALEAVYQRLAEKTMAKHRDPEPPAHRTPTRGHEVFTASEIHEIRLARRNGESPTNLAKRFKCSDSTMYAILSGRGYKHVPWRHERTVVLSKPPRSKPK